MPTDGIDSAKAAAFDKRIFAGPLDEKTYARFVAAMTPITCRNIRSRR
jgi:hypothetical protein